MAPYFLNDISDLEAQRASLHATGEGGALLAGFRLAVGVGVLGSQPTKPGAPSLPPSQMFVFAFPWAKVSDSGSGKSVNDSWWYLAALGGPRGPFPTIMREGGADRGAR